MGALPRCNQKTIIKKYLRRGSNPYPWHFIPVNNICYNMSVLSNLDDLDNTLYKSKLFTIQRYCFVSIYASVFEFFYKKNGWLRAVLSLLQYHYATNNMSGIKLHPFCILFRKVIYCCLKITIHKSCQFFW